MSGVNLTKGGNLDLGKAAPTSQYFRVGLGWNVKADSTVANEFDLDVISVLCNSDDKGATESGVFFYNNVDGSGTSSNAMYNGMDDAAVTAKALSLIPNSVVVVTKDNLTGEGDGDDETLYVNPAKLGDDQKIKVTVNIYEAMTRRQNFGMVNGAFVRVLDDTNTEICRYDLSEDFSVETGTIIGEFYKKDGSLKFKALGMGFSGDLNTLLNQLR